MVSLCQGPFPLHLYHLVVLDLSFVWGQWPQLKAHYLTSGHATRGGLVKTDWSKAPFTASYRNFNAAACVWSRGSSSSASNFRTPVLNTASQNQGLDAERRRKLQLVQKNYMIYNYCSDMNHFPEGLPPEC